MSTVPNGRVYQLDYGTDSRAVFNFFNAVYAWMCVGLAITACSAWLTSQNIAAFVPIYNKGGSIAFLLVGLLCVWGIQGLAHKVSPGVATALFLVYAAIVGVMLAPIFLIYKLGTLTSVFAITGGTFAACSAFGYLTKWDMSGLRGFFIMGIWGLLIATVVNIFWANTALDWIISYFGLFLFIGLTAYDSQKLKEIAQTVHGDSRRSATYAIIGALRLYLDFVNMFIFMLRILGNRR